MPLQPLPTRSSATAHITPGPTPAVPPRRTAPCPAIVTSRNTSPRAPPTRRTGPARAEPSRCDNPYLARPHPANVTAQITPNPADPNLCDSPCLTPPLPAMPTFCTHSRLSTYILYAKKIFASIRIFPLTAHRRASIFSMPNPEGLCSSRLPTISLFAVAWAADTQGPSLRLCTSATGRLFNS